jgi:hypothetical protein
MDQGGNGKYRRSHVKFTTSKVPKSNNSSAFISANTSQKASPKDRKASQFGANRQNSSPSLYQKSLKYIITWKETRAIRKLSFAERVIHKLTHGGFSDREIKEFLKANKCFSVMDFYAILNLFMENEKDKLTQT